MWPPSQTQLVRSLVRGPGLVDMRGSLELLETRNTEESMKERRQKVGEGSKLKLKSLSYSKSIE